MTTILKLKICTKCLKEKPISEFNYRKESSDNLTSWCRDCLKLKNKIWAERNKSYLREKRKNDRIVNPEKHKLRFKKWYNKNRENQLARAKDYRINNPEKVRTSNRRSCRKRRKNDINYRLTLTLRSRVNNVIKRHGGKKAYKAIDLIGCDIETFKNHISSKFTEGMSFENHGKWHIDHIVPCALFDLKNPEEQKICFHYTNLQPLWAADNIKKRDKLL